MLGYKENYKNTLALIFKIAFKEISMFSKPDALVIKANIRLTYYMLMIKSTLNHTKYFVQVVMEIFIYPE